MVVKIDLAGEPADQRDRLMAQSEEVLRRRLVALGIVSPKMARDGPDRIVADIAGYSDLERLRGLFQSARKVSFRLVDEDLKDDDIRAGRVPQNVEIVTLRPARPGEEPSPLALYRGEVIGSERIHDAHEKYDSRLGAHMVVFRFDSLGAEQFAKVTEENVGGRFAIVLDGQVVVAPYIVTPILGGSGQITGNFTDQEASDLAILLRAGAAPAQWSIAELKQTP